MADPNSGSKTKWLWLLIIIILGIVLLLWVFGAADDDQPAELAAPIGVTDESALPTRQEGAVEVQLPDSDFELPPPETAPETQPEIAPEAETEAP